jgi:HD-like signal output (HDOD) protein
MIQKTCESCKRTFQTEQDFYTNTFQWRVCSSENLWFNCICGSTLMLPKGKFPWYNPRDRLSPESQSIFNKISNIQNLPHIPNQVMKIQEMIQNPLVEITDLAKAIKKDPFLAAEVLKVSENLRSLRNKNQAPMKSLEHAVSYIGKKNLGDLVITASIRSFELPTEIFQEKLFWKHSMLVAAITEILSEKFLPTSEKDKVYLAGCLSNIGKIIGAMCFKEKTDKIQDFILNPKTATFWENAEKKFDMVSHCLLGEIGAALWGMPTFISDAARNHHQKETTIGLNSVIGLAHILAYWVLLEPTRIDPDLLQHYKVLFQLTESSLEELVMKEIAPLAANLAF